MNLAIPADDPEFAAVPIQWEYEAVHFFFRRGVAPSPNLCQLQVYLMTTESVAYEFAAGWICNVTEEINHGRLRNAWIRDQSTTCRPTAGSRNRGTCGPDLPDDKLPVPRFRACRQSFR